MGIGIKFFGAGLILLALVAVGEGLRVLGTRPAVSRCVVHVGVGIVVAALPWVFDRPGSVYALAALFVVGNAVARRRQWWPGMHRARPQSLGTITFPLALFPALLLGWRSGAEHLFAFQAAFLILAVSDPLAAWVGRRYGRECTIGSSTKSWAGSLAFAGSAAVVCVFTLMATTVASGWDIVGLSVVVAGAAALTEALGGRGWDNFFIVPVVMVPLVVWDLHPERLGLMVVGVGAGLLFAALTWRGQMLSRSGSLAGGLLAASLIGVGGLSWAVPALVFFGLSSALSRVGRKQKRTIAARNAKGDVRDAGQVYANGGAGWMLLLVHAVGWGAPPLYGGFLGAFAAAAADTWATELGTLGQRRPRLITTGRAVPPGTSGAVSGWGTAAALAGAASVALSAWTVAPDGLGRIGGEVWIGIVLVIAAGMGGALVDSLAGATIQAQYRTAHDGLTERPTDQPQRGWTWVTNDCVNWIGTVAGAIVAGVGTWLLGG